MNLPSDYHLLIVDNPSERACSLRNALVTAGATVHVVATPDVALMVARRRKIHTAFIACDTDMDMTGLCHELTKLNVPQIFTGAIPPNQPTFTSPPPVEPFSAAARS
jgi:PleD family two-component response regulator